MTLCGKVRVTLGDAYMKYFDIIYTHVVAVSLHLICIALNYDERSGMLRVQLQPLECNISRYISGNNILLKDNKK